MNLANNEEKTYKEVEILRQSASQQPRITNCQTTLMVLNLANYRPDSAFHHKEYNAGVHIFSTVFSLNMAWSYSKTVQTTFLNSVSSDLVEVYEYLSPWQFLSQWVSIGEWYIVRQIHTPLVSSTCDKIDYIVGSKASRVLQAPVNTEHRIIYNWGKFLVQILN